MKIDRLAVPPGISPFDLFEYDLHRCHLVHHQTGKVLFDLPDCEVPAAWSNEARNTLISKYFRLGGVPDVTETAPGHTKLPEWLRPRRAAEGATLGGETSIRQVVDRMVGHWTYTGWLHGYFAPTPEERKEIRGIEDTDMRTQRREEIVEGNARNFYDEMVYMLLNQTGAPNSPQWFNTGLWWAYGLAGEAQGHYRTHTKSPHHVDNVPADLAEWNAVLDQHTVASDSAYEHVQAHACFILEVQDKLVGENGILAWYAMEGKLFKFGSGSGTSLDQLRGAGEPLSGGGTASGTLSWMSTGDRNAGAIKSGGTTRRAAAWRGIDIDHPDILAFTECKVASEGAVASMVVGSQILCEGLQILMDMITLVLANEGATLDDALNDPTVRTQVRHLLDRGVPHNYLDKALYLARDGVARWPTEPYTSDWGDSAYEMIPFQNANHSVRIPTAFFTACDRNEPWDLYARTDRSRIFNTITARSLLHRIAKASWFCGDPGVQFSTTINDWNTTPADGTIDASNPCSEHLRLPNSACNLASVRLTAFDQGDRTLDLDRFAHAVRLWTITQDITNTMAHLPSAATAKSVFSYRDMGLGYADLGALLMGWGLPYDSGTGRAVAAAITAILTSQCMATSAELAAALGPYPRWHHNAEHHLRVVRNHRACLGHTDELVGLTVQPQRIDEIALALALGGEAAAAWATLALHQFDTALALAAKTGLRNAEHTVLAPTGTIGVTMDCETTGVEPVIAMQVVKTLAGGGEMLRSASDAVKRGLGALGYGPSAIGGIIEHIQQHNCLPLGVVEEDHRAVFDTAFPNADGDTIAWEGHIRMMGAVQPFLSGAISKTVNMPVETSVDAMAEAIRLAHDLGVKAVALYRDQSKLDQPLKSTSPTASLTNALTAAEPAELLSPAPPTGGRMRLGPIREAGIDVAVDLGMGKLYVRTTRYPDGKCAEIWATYSADQGIVQAMLAMLCKTANVALQWGVPLDSILTTWSDSNFEPRGMVGSHPQITLCRSLTNLLARLVLWHELGDPSVLNVKPSEAGVVTEGVPEALTAPDPSMHFAGESCPNCGSLRYVTSGSGCKKCLDCGTAGGCG
jgi:ribonucleoside-diphosphate reductase alpha chain